MLTEEIKVKLNDIAEQISELKQSERQIYAELGKKLFPEVSGNPEHAEIAAQINEINEKLNGFREEQANLQGEYNRRIAALTCYYCKTVNADGSSYCEECGAKLGEKPKEYCESCGTMNHPGQKFCGECGTKLGAE